MDIVGSFNNNKYIYAMMMILLNIGARYIEMDLQDVENFFHLRL